MHKGSLNQIAYILALIGGIILIIMGILSFLGTAARTLMFVPSILGGSLGGFAFAIIVIILGIVAIYGSKRATDLTWGIILVIVGLIAGGLGGVLVLLGGICGLLSRFI